MASISSASDIGARREPTSTELVSMPKSPHTLRATRSLSPVITLVTTPSSARRRIEGPASTFGRSAKTRKPSRCNSYSKAGDEVAAVGTGFVATAMTREPASNSRSRNARAAFVTSGHRSRIPSGSPLATKRCEPSGATALTEANAVELFDGPLGSILIEKSQTDRKGDDDGDDQRVGVIARPAGNERGSEQKE